MPTARQPPQQRDQAVVVVEPDPARREAIRAALDADPADDWSRDPGRSSRRRIRFAHDCDEGARLVTAEVTALVLNLTVASMQGVKLIEALRPERSDLAILCYVTAAPRAEAMAAMVAGADHVADFVDGRGLHHALDLAVDRRWLGLLIDRSVADIEEARHRIARLGGNGSVVLPGLRPPPTAAAVLPFNEAVRRYLVACARLFEGDPRGLAERLGVSYFALRRLLKRYAVPFPGRTPRKRK